MSLCRRLVLLVLVQRRGEVAWTRRNERRLRAAGADEVGARHYPLSFLLHGSCSPCWRCWCPRRTGP